MDFLGSGDALLDRWFTSERLKAALAWFGAQSGPPMAEPGTASMVGFAALLHDVPPGHPVGGSGGLTAALRRRLESDGGRVVLGDGAARLLVEGGRASGVETVSGRRIHAGAVVAACHIGTTRALPAPPLPRPGRRGPAARQRLRPHRPGPHRRAARLSGATAEQSAHGLSCCAPTGPTSRPRTATGRPAGSPATRCRSR